MREVISHPPNQKFLKNLIYLRKIPGGGLYYLYRRQPFLWKP